MGPLKHVILTIVLYALLCLFFIKFSLYVLIASILLGILVDVIDHGAQILFVDTQLSRDIRTKLQTSGVRGIRKVYKEYYIRRMGEIEFMFIHNPIVIVVILIVAVITGNQIIWLGLMFHLMCDIYENTREGMLIKFIKSPIKLCQYLKGDTTGGSRK